LYQLLEEVLPYFALFYVFDSLAFVAAGEVLFARRFRVFEAHRGGPVLAGLLPSAEVLSGLELPLRLSRSAVAWPATDGFVGIPWENLGKLTREDRTLRAAGHTLKAPSPEAAEYLTTLLVRLRDTPVGRRDRELVAVFDERSDVTAVRALRSRLSRFVRPLGILGFVGLVGAFLLIPLGLADRFPLLPDPAWVLLGLAPAYLAVLVLAWRSLRGGGVRPSACLGTLTPLFFFPPAAAHVRSVLARRLYSAFDPMVLAAALLPAAAFRDFARERFHRLRQEGAEGEFAEHLALAEAAWRRAVAASGQTVETVLAAPSTTDPSASSYCPLCSTEYRLGFPVCSECRVALLPLRPLPAP